MSSYIDVVHIIRNIQSAMRRTWIFLMMWLTTCITSIL